MAVAIDTQHPYIDLVIYKSLLNGLVWGKPYDIFISKVDHEKFPDTTQKYKYEKVN